MEVSFTLEQLERLSQLAVHQGVAIEQLVKDVALQLLEEDADFQAAVRKGIEQADRGELIDEAEGTATAANIDAALERFRELFPNGDFGRRITKEEEAKILGFGLL